MLGGYLGKTLFIDLTRGTVSEQKLRDEDCYRLIGGYGFGVKVLLEQQRRGVDPLGPENIIGFITGPLTGTGAPLGGRYMAVSKSPLTGAWGNANSGGYFGVRLKFAGYDAVFLSGISDKPVYVLITNESVELCDASNLWGHDTYETEDMLRSELGLHNMSVSCIGMAGEKQSLIASVIVDKARALGRCGLGAVMGSKYLKAIVAAGNQKVPIAEPQRLKELRAEFLKTLKEQPNDLAETLKTYGTPGLFGGAIKSGVAPIKNWQLSGEQDFPDYGKLHAESVTRYQQHKVGCYGCPIACGGTLKIVNDEQYSITESHKPEYETIAGFGPQCLNADLISIVKANDICNRAGMDTISASSTVAFAMECYDKGLINSRITGGIDLTWGNARAIVSLLELMAKRQGFGEVLADGSRAAAARIGKGADELAMHVCGQEVAYRHPLFSPSRSTMYVADAAPGRHTAGTAAEFMEVGAKLGPYLGLGPLHIERYDYQTKGPMQVLASNYQAAFESAGICFMAMLFGTYRFVDFMASVTGKDISLQELISAGERIINLRQVFNLREGLRTETFNLPNRLLGIPPLQEGPLAGITIDIDKLVTEYYKARDWAIQDGWQSTRKLESLGLLDIVEKAGFLASKRQG